MPMSKWASIADRLRTVYKPLLPFQNCLHETFNLLGQSSKATYANEFGGRTHARKSSVRNRKIVRVLKFPSIPSVTQSIPDVDPYVLHPKRLFIPTKAKAVHILRLKNG